MNAALLNHGLRVAPANQDAIHLIAMGASAGGPAALARIIGSLPASFKSCVVIVQHVARPFAPALANWLNEQSRLPVRVAEEGERPQPGRILVAGRDRHLVLLDDGSLGYRIRPFNCAYRPSVDVLFESVAENWRGPATGVLLTGMGRDGAKGLFGLRQAGHYTIAQDQASSAVYGMPREAMELGAAEEVLPLEQIGLRLRSREARSLQPHV